MQSRYCNIAEIVAFSSLVVRRPALPRFGCFARIVPPCSGYSLYLLYCAYARSRVPRCARPYGQAHLMLVPRAQLRKSQIIKAITLRACAPILAIQPMRGLSVGARVRVKCSFSAMPRYRARIYIYIGIVKTFFLSLHLEILYLGL